MSLVRTTEELGETEAPDDNPASYRIPVPRFTVAILISISAVFAVQLRVDGIGLNSSATFLFHELRNSALAAGFIKPAFLRDGEYWLILTGAFLHGFLAHYAMNSYAFYSFGKLFELLTNRAQLPIVFLASAVAGGLLSLYFMPAGTSVGASGGIVGLIGYLLVYAFRRRRFVSAEFRNSLIINIGFILIFGFMLYGIVDNWGHIGGLLAGGIYGLIQIPSDEYKNPHETGVLTEIAGLAALGLCVAISIFSIYLMWRA